MGKTVIEKRIEDIEKKINDLNTGGVDVEALKNQIIQSIPKQEPAEMPKIDTDAIINEARSYVDGHIIKLNERFNVDGESINKRFDEMLERIKVVEDRINEVLSSPLFQEVEDEPAPEPEQPPQ